MKLSEAIRLGAMLKPHGVGSLLSDGATCAIGAALDACGKLASEDDLLSIAGCMEAWDEAERLWPAIINAHVAHPVRLNHGGPSMEPLSTTVTDLNDSFGWTREQIADWVATIEAQQDERQGVESVSRPESAAASKHPRDEASSEVHSLSPVTILARRVDAGGVPA